MTLLKWHTPMKKRAMVALALWRPFFIVMWAGIPDIKDGSRTFKTKRWGTRFYRQMVARCPF